MNTSKMGIPSLLSDPQASGPSFWQDFVTWVSENAEIVAIISIILLILVLALLTILVFLTCKLCRHHRVVKMPDSNDQRQPQSDQTITRKNSRRDNFGLTTSTSEDETTPLMDYKYNGYTNNVYAQFSNFENTNSTAPAKFESAATERSSPKFDDAAQSIPPEAVDKTAITVHASSDDEEDDGPPPVAPARRKSSVARADISVAPSVSTSRLTRPKTPQISQTSSTPGLKRPLTPLEANRRRSSTFNRYSPNQYVSNSRTPVAPVRRKSAATQLAKDMPPLSPTEVADHKQNSRPRAVSIADQQPKNLPSVQDRTRSASTTDLPRRYTPSESEEVFL